MAATAHRNKGSRNLENSRYFHILTSALLGGSEIGGNELILLNVITYEGKEVTVTFKNLLYRSSLGYHKN